MPNLIDTISDDGSLADRLAAMPPDKKTITLVLAQEHGLIHHPDWDSDVTAPALTPQPNPIEDSPVSEIDLTETVDFSNLPIRQHPSEGFIPPRKVTSLTQNKSEDDEQVEYRLIGQLGSGGTGVVYQAHQRAIDREVAIKVLRRELAADPQSRARFLTEARVIGALDHPNVIALHDLCIDDSGQLFYAMKRVDGTNWNEQIGQLGVDENVSILLRVADAIRYAHSRGLVHRDLKPENVMLGRFGEVLVADWGLAVNCFPDPSGRTGLASEQDSAIGGTPAYMAPELAKGDLSSIGYHTDVYLLGAMLYQILSGYPPHHGKNLLACIQAAAHNEIRSTDAQGELVDVAMRAMATEPADRYDSVDAFVAALAVRRTHEESERLVRRAKRIAWETPPENSSDPYEQFGGAITLLHEATELWPENQCANDTLARVQVDFARVAASHGDLDLSIRLFESAGEGDSEAASRVRRDRDRRDKARENQAKYSALFTHSPEAGLLVRWADGVVMEANLACLDLLGYEKDEFVGRVVADLAIWACPDRRQQFVNRLSSEGRIDNFECQFVPKTVNLEHNVCEDDTVNTAKSDSRLIDVLISARTVEVGGQEMLLSTIRDISIRREAERNLQQSRRRLLDLQRLAGLGTWSFHPKTNEIQWSSETYRITGRAPKKGTPDYDEFINLIHPDDRSVLSEAITKALQSGASYQVRFRQRDDAGDYRWLSARGQPVLNDDGETVELYGVLTRVSAAESATE
ncbi:MAG: protein kinase [Pirellulaceae bacterium]|nr:protein kinase [Pirellulaceae bacterium]